MTDTAIRPDRQLRVLDLFSGIGGFSLGLERAGMRTVAFCEIDPYCRKVLRRHWPEVPIYEDVRTLTADALERDGIAVDFVCGGFPCQDVSGAGKRAGISGSRSGLFRELVRTLRMVRPKGALLENVAALLHRGMGDVLGELADSGLRVEWDCIPAYAVGAPHNRDRVWIVAYPDPRQQPERLVSSVRRRGQGPGTGTENGNDADANGQWKLQPGWCFHDFWGRPFYRGTGGDEWRTHWLDRLGALRGMDDGVSRRLDEARPLGNAVVPQIPEIIGRAILGAMQ